MLERKIYAVHDRDRKTFLKEHGLKIAGLTLCAYGAFVGSKAFEFLATRMVDILTIIIS